MRKTRLFRSHERAELAGAIADTRATFEAKGVCVSAAERELGVIRFGGHLSRGEYDVQTDGRHTEATSASPVHR